MRVFIGIDPGCGSPPGGIVEISTRGVYRYPWTTAKNMWEIVRGLAAISDNCRAVIEMVTRPRKLVENAGVWKGLLTAAGIPFKEVAPKTWQKHFSGQLPKDRKLRKQRLLEIAQQRYPDVDIPLNLADAVLLADYAREVAWR